MLRRKFLHSGTSLVLASTLPLHLLPRQLAIPPEFLSIWLEFRDSLMEAEKTPIGVHHSCSNLLKVRASLHHDLLDPSSDFYYLSGTGDKVLLRYRNGQSQILINPDITAQSAHHV